MFKNSNTDKRQNGFTIVELLVVIVVIGILAAISFVSYSGIAGRARAASMQSDLANAAKVLNSFRVLHADEDYPATINCLIPDSATNKCIRTNPPYSFIYAVSNGTNPKTFTLDITNGTLVYRITHDTIPVSVTTTPITAIAAISGTTSIGSVLTAGAITPGGATVSYKWQSATTVGGVYSDISGATSNTYTLVAGDWTKYIKVVATGTGSYSGAQTSVATSVVSNPVWLAGVGALAGKYVYNVDAVGTYTWANRSNGCLSGGRIPTLTEMTAVYTNRASYGNNFNSAGYYWTNTIYDANNWYVVVMADGTNFTASNPGVELFARCIHD